MTAAWKQRRRRRIKKTNRVRQKIYETETLAQAMCAAVMATKDVELVAWPCRFASHWHISKPPSSEWTTPVGSPVTWSLGA